MGLLSCGGDVTVHVKNRNKPTELAHSFFHSVFVSVSVFLALRNCISLHKFSPQLSTLSVCYSGLTAALLVLSTIHLFIKVSFSPDIILCG